MDASTFPDAELAAELPLCFACASETPAAGGAARLVGILTLPAAPGPRGVLIVTGGPQYRAGSHRQFALLARALAARGVPVLRFDYRGMGDSEGEARSYRAIGNDIDSALAQFFSSVPGMREVVLWGLCDGATAAACHAPRDARITGLVLLNPWVRSSATLARATLRHYYLPRLLQGAFWRKLASLRLPLRASLAGLRRAAASVLQVDGDTRCAEASPAESMHAALSRFDGQVLLILSGADLGAREWEALLAGSAAWRSLCARPAWQHAGVAGANHTFASAVWRAQVEQRCLAWLATW